MSNDLADALGLKYPSFFSSSLIHAAAAAAAAIVASLSERWAIEVCSGPNPHGEKASFPFRPWTLLALTNEL